MIKIYSAILISILSLPASARWAGPDDAPTAVTLARYTYTVHKDGTYVLVGEKETEIRKEKSRIDDGLFRTTFIPSMESFELIHAETRNGKQIIPVDKKNVEIKPLASTGPGFDSTSQVTIAYPDVKIGSKLYIKFRRVVKRASYPGEFSIAWPFGWHENVASMVVEFNSDMPLFYELVDVEKYFKAESSPKHLRFTLRKPIYRMAMEEEFPIYDPRSFVWLGVTNLKEWNQFPQKTVAAYENVLSSPLPEKFQEIMKAAQLKTTTVDQINTVTSMLADSIRYVGDWRAVKGTYIPRSLKEVASTGYGDCKDFSSVTGAILRKMGYDVNSAWIARGQDWIVAPISIAVPDVNHAILVVRKDGKEMFIDPTNATSFAQNIFTDIADRPVVVLSPKGVYVRRTPAMQASDGEWITTGHLNFLPDGKISVKGTLTLDGRGALPFTGAEVFGSKAGTDYSLISWLVNPANLIDWKVGPYSLTSRIVGRFETNYEYSEKWRPTTSTAGSGYMVSSIPWLSYFRFKRDGRASDLNVGYPLKVKRNYRISGKRILLSKEIKCSGKSPWADFDRNMHLEKGALIINESIDFKMKEVPAVDIAKQAFAEFQDQILQCMQDAVVVFK